MSWKKLGQSGWEKWNGHLIQIVSLHWDNYVFLRVLLDSKISNPAWPQLKTITGNGAAAHAIASPRLPSSARWMRLSWHPQPLVFRSSLLRVGDWHRLGFCAGAVVLKTGLGTPPAAFMAPDCFRTSGTKQAPAGRGTVKRISSALTYPCMVYHPVAKHSYYIWRRRATTRNTRNMRWSSWIEPRSYLPYFTMLIKQTKQFPLSHPKCLLLHCSSSR